MDQKEKKLVAAALASFEHTTGLKAVFQSTSPREKSVSDGLIKIEHQEMLKVFVPEVKKRVSRAIVAALKAEAANFQKKLILITDYVTPPIADLLKEMDLCFIDAAGNA